MQDIEKIGKAYSRWAIIVIVIGGICILILPWLFTSYSWNLNFLKTGQIGDTIGGITAPVIGFMSALLIYFSFMIQYRANRLQWQAIKDEQILNRMPIIIDEIEKIIEQDRLRQGIKVSTFISQIISKQTISVYNTFIKNSKYDMIINIYIGKIVRAIAQVKESGLNMEIIDDFLSGLLLIDRTFFKNLKMLDDYMSENYDSVIDNIKKENIDDEIKEKFLVKIKYFKFRVDLYVSKIEALEVKYFPK